MEKLKNHVDSEDDSARLNDWKDEDIRAWLYVWREECLGDRKKNRHKRWVLFCEKMKFLYGVIKTNEECRYMVSSQVLRNCFFTVCQLQWTVHTAEGQVILFVFIVYINAENSLTFLFLQKTYIFKRYAYLTTTGRNGFHTSLDTEIMEICRHHPEIVGDTVGSSTTGIVVKGMLV